MANPQMRSGRSYILSPMRPDTKLQPYVRDDGNGGLELVVALDDTSRSVLAISLTPSHAAYLMSMLAPYVSRHVRPAPKSHLDPS